VPTNSSPLLVASTTHRQTYKQQIETTKNNTSIKKISFKRERTNGTDSMLQRSREHKTTQNGTIAKGDMTIHMFAINGEDRLKT